MTCACGRDNDHGRRYCGGCGVRLGAACPRCAFANGVDDRFCGGCGDALGATAVARREAPAASDRTIPGAAIDGSIMSAAELASLLGMAAPVAPLPAVLDQDDLDRLFGGPS